MEYELLQERMGRMEKELLDVSSLGNKDDKEVFIPNF